MNMRTHFGAIILSILFLHIFADAQTVQSTTEPTFSAEQLRDGAEKTYVNFNRAWQAGTETQVDQIPSKYWTDAIKSLKPIRVYLHRVNLVVVQREQDGTEEGKYFQLTISSYLPMNGVDGFVYTPNPQRGSLYSTGNGVFDFKRTTRHSVIEIQRLNMQLIQTIT